jgi:hypothetical protein
MAFLNKVWKELIIRKKILFAPFWIKMKTRWRMWWESKRIERERELYRELKENSSKNQACSYAMLCLRKIWKNESHEEISLTFRKYFLTPSLTIKCTLKNFLCCNNIHAQFQIRILTTCGTLLRSIVIVWV